MTTATQTRVQQPGLTAPDIIPPASVTITSSANVPAESLQIRQALWLLYEIDDREAWQRDLISALLEKANADIGYDPATDPQLDGILAGFHVFYQQFEVRADLTFRHRRDRFDAAGFLHLTGPWTYADNWWSSVSDDDLRLAETLLTKTGILEYREVGQHPNVVTCLRLRADKITKVLLEYQLEKYEN